MSKITHEIGSWFVDNGTMINRITGLHLDEDIAVCYSSNADDEIFSLHKVGKSENVELYYNKAITKLIANGFSDLANEFKTFKFNIKYPELNYTPNNYNFTIDEVCTLINWWSNSPGYNGIGILTMSLDEIKAKLEKLQEIGF